jgi:MFS family permease
LSGSYTDAEVSNMCFVQGTQKTAQAMGKMANGMFAAGAACAGLSALLSAMGFDEASEAASKLSGIIMGLGALFTVLPPIITGVGKVVATTGITAQAAWGWIGIIAALIVGLVVAIAAMSKANNGLAKDIEKINSQIDQMTTAAKEAGDALESITEARKELAEMQSTFAGLTKGTDEWRKALVDSNSKVLELLNSYP